MISRKTKYGLQSLIYLSKKYGKGPVLIAELAKKERCHFLHGRRSCCNQSEEPEERPEK